MPSSEYPVLLRETYYLILKIVARYWRRLPTAAKSYYSFEDMVSDVCAAVLSVPYDARRGKPTTYVWRVAQNCCQNRVVWFYAKQRNAPVVLIRPEDSFPFLAMWPDLKLALGTVTEEAREGFLRVAAGMDWPVSSSSLVELRQALRGFSFDEVVRQMRSLDCSSVL